MGNTDEAVRCSSTIPPDAHLHSGPAAATGASSWRYTATIPPDARKCLELLCRYSQIPKSDIEKHVVETRERCFDRFPRAFVGRFRFLNLYLAQTGDVYAEILGRIKHSGDEGCVFLEAGCGFGQVLRQLAWDGGLKGERARQRLVGVDLERELVDFGYGLFRDAGKFAARFVVGDLLQERPQDKELKALEGTVNVVHAQSLFHLFGRDDQVNLGVRLVRLLRTDDAGAMVLGRHVDSAASQEALQQMWDIIGEKTGTQWSVRVHTSRLVEAGGGTGKMGVQFIARRR